MTFKECRKYGREEINNSRSRHGYIYKDNNCGYYFSLIYYNSPDLVYVLEKNGVVNKVINGKWKWDYEKRGMNPQNEKGWNKRKK